MTTGYAGRLAVVKIGDGATTEAFVTIAGARTKSLTINNQDVDITNDDSAGFQEFLNAKVVQSFQISIEGVTTNSATLDDLQAVAETAGNNNFQFIFSEGRTYEGAFRVPQFQRGAAYNGEETFTATLQSTGTIAYTGGTT